MNRYFIKMGVFFFIPFGLIKAQTAKDIVEKADELIRANSSYTEMKMEVIKPDWSREMEMKIWSLEPDYALLLITAPAKDKGMVTLKRKKEVWNWVPSVHRVIKIPPSMMLQSWMGSDFTNDDLVRQSSIVEDYTHALIGEEEMEGYLCHKIEMTPKPEAGVVWGKILVWISKEGYLQLRADYYDEDDPTFWLKRMVESDIRVFDNIPTAMKVVMYNKNDNTQTELELLEVEYNITLADSMFTERGLKK